MRWPRSLQAQLAIRLTAVLLIAAAVGVIALFHESDQTADALRREELLRRAEELTRLIERTPDGTVVVRLSQGLAQVFNKPGATDLFVVRADGDGILATSRPDLAPATGAWPAAAAEPRYSRIRGFGAAGQEYCALSLRAGSAAGPVSVIVARAIEADSLAHTVLKDFARDISWSWAILLFALAILAVGIWSIRRGLDPLRAVSACAATIGPGMTGVRLSGDRLPTELLPLVAGFNQALDRLERGLILQREFTANAAHQLRTPLAILTAQLDQLADSPSVQLLRGDAARMNRLVEQLLRVARLDNLPPSHDAVELNALAAKAVRGLAAWAIGRHRMIGFDGPEQPVWVSGQADAVEDALRNLIENAIIYSPPQTEVTITVLPEGAVSISDHGPGIPEQDRPRIFERFWRGRAAQGAGAGLGLAIVAQVAAAHEGSVEVEETPGGGATFTLRLKSVADKSDSPARSRAAASR
ncbi:sensor histidine kinase [Bradyrhizobium ottawaense]|uniref:sensor histidine kinase n=1 Tax=Bradyrhizobium ottawaense TaxID=931866 RepID=UPI003FA05DFB